ncbi:hypothetical protein [Bradyrhizobium sp. CCBAU 51753]|uniref:hypothetical protein n=1 Tax=Bradyrhizobium sp. CCBAU 51753 TaxID=1325100 RepID=UPI00188A4184|nr:hypothetical protein [Bradyrhizobium sp. CCBAU 51753]
MATTVATCSAVQSVGAKGLDGGIGDADTVYGRNDDPAVKAQYDQQQLKRDEQIKGS